MFSALNGFVGYTPFNDWFVADTVQRHPLGTELIGVDPYWGQGAFVYLKSNATILKGSFVAWDETHTAVLLPNTANQGFPTAVAMGNASAGVYFWAQVKGLAVYKTNATVAADAAIGITAAGIVGANSAGKQILGVRNRIAATGTKTFANTQTTANSAKLFCPQGYDGAFLGLTLTGTGVPASTVVAALDPDGKTIYMGSAIGTVDKLATATGIVTVTGTYTGYGAGIIMTPFCQGAIT